MLHFGPATKNVQRKRSDIPMEDALVVLPIIEPYLIYVPTSELNRVFYTLILSCWGHVSRFRWES